MARILWKAVIFDYGKVLSHGPTAEDLQQFTALTGIPDPARFVELYANTRAEYDAGRADYRQHWKDFSDAANVDLAEDKIDRLAVLENSMWLRLNAETLGLAREVKIYGVKIAILSNMPTDLLLKLRSRFDWLDEFDVQTWSCELGIVKPSAGIYRACLERLRCEPEHVLFFDDRLRNVEAACELGMEAHLFESATQARAIVHRGM